MLTATGPAKLGCPHPLDSAYIIYFACLLSDGQLDDSPTFQSAMLSLSPSSAIFIHVDGIAVPPSSTMPQMFAHSTQDDDGRLIFPVEQISFLIIYKLPGNPVFQQPLEDVSESSSNRLRQHYSTPTIAWLAQQASLRNNYQLFVSSNHRVLQNSEIILVWKFASDFYDVYYRAKSEMVCVYVIFILLTAHNCVLGHSH